MTAPESPRPVLVGEANPYGGDPEFALYPSPPGCSGERLCNLILQLDPDDYVERFERCNLCPHHFGVREARERAAALLAQSPSRRFVLLGAKVARAFGLAWAPFTRGEVRAEYPVATHSWVQLPHPSGLSRSWNEPGAFERARAVLREAGVL